MRADAVDVIGIDCRFPTANSPQAFWDMLIRGEHGISEVPAERWPVRDYYAPEGGEGRANTRSAGFIDDPEVFDYGFFGVSPAEAQAMDVQQRLVLQASWRALEDAGIDPVSVRGSETGVFVGVMSSDWGALHLGDFAGMTAQRGVGNGYCLIANRVSYHLDLRGPSLAVDTACSSSLVAVHLAVNALRTGECDLAVVAGVNLMLTPALSIFYTQAGLSAPDGRCRPFSDHGGGIGRGEGVGAVVLRRRADRPAVAPAPYAAVLGSAVNQDGRSNGLTAPTRWAQQAVIEKALTSAQVAADAIDFIEGHGTGTKLGDTVEVRALGAVLDGTPVRPRLLGSVKGNVGHCEGAAGIAGFIKACLALSHRMVPPSLFADEENPKLDLAAMGLRLARTPERLGRGTVYAGVSSFGLGGTNAHVVLAGEQRTRSRPSRGEFGVLTVSGNSAAAARANLIELADALDADQWAQTCFASNVVKAGLPYRIPVVADSFAELSDGVRRAIARLATADNSPVHHRPARVAFVFTGQGAQYQGMGSELAARTPAFAEHLRVADAALAPHFGSSIIAAIDNGVDAQGRSIDATAVAQPALFAIQIALVRYLADLGVAPVAVLGHSVGEFAAAVCAGALTLDDAAALVVARGALMQALPEGGAMLSAELDEAAAAELVAAHGDTGIAAVNGPRSVVFSGASESIEAIAAELTGREVRIKRLTVSHAFHSPLMGPAAEPLRARADEVSVAAARIPMLSTVTGAAVTETDLTGDYWATQLLGTVQFDLAAQTLATLRPTHVVEIGPRGVLAGLLRASGTLGTTELLAPIASATAGITGFAETIAALWRDGVGIDWQPLYPETDGRLRRLPGYVFADEQRFLVSATSVPRAPVAAAQVAVEAERTPAGSVAVVTETVQDSVYRVLAKIGGYQRADLAAHLDLRADLGFDSVMVMQFADRITTELQLGTAPDPAEMHAAISTVGSLTELVERLVRKEAP